MATPDSSDVPHRTTRTRLVLGFLVIYVVWGSTYLAIRWGVETIPPFIMGAVRFLLAGGMMYAYSRWRGAKAPTMREWRASAIVGALLLFIGNGAVSWSEQRVSSGMTSLLVATVPIAVVTNAARVTVTGILSERDPELAKGFFHSAEGWLIFSVALALLLLTHHLIKLVIRPRAGGNGASAAV